jgi:glycine/D-amino acid oxidase-like deaminating enzyme
MSSPSSEIIICGAGIAGVSAAYFLAQQGVRDITLVDELPPLNLTSSRSTECYRNWWPDPEMLSLMNRSIDLLESIAEKSGNIFSLNKRGYLFVTADIDKIPAMTLRAQKISDLGAGPLRIHTESNSTYISHKSEGFDDKLTGADLLLGSHLVGKHFPYLTEDSIAALHVRRAGWMSAQQLGMLLLDQARTMGVRFISGKVTGVEITNNQVQSVSINAGENIRTGTFVNAAGPYFKSTGNLCGLDIPVKTELHLKVAFKDRLGAINRESPLLIWDDPQVLDWSQEEAEELKFDPETKWLTEPFPPGAHTRPEGGHGSDVVLMLWEYQEKEMDPSPNPPLDEFYPEVALRGLTRMIPALKGYYGRSPRPLLDGGFYTKSGDNRPIVGPTSVKGLFLTGALSGYGIMSACGVGELISLHISGGELPVYSNAFMLNRFSDPAHLAWMKSVTDSGQL